MAATLKLRRTAGGIELRRGRFDIQLDDTEIGSIELDQTFETTLEPGHHTLQMRRGRHSSRPESFDAAEGAVVEFRCHGAEVWPRWLASAFKPDLAISLKRG